MPPTEADRKAAARELESFDGDGDEDLAAAMAEEGDELAPLPGEDGGGDNEEKPRPGSDDDYDDDDVDDVDISQLLGAPGSPEAKMTEQLKAEFAAMSPGKKASEVNTAAEEPTPSKVAAAPPPPPPPARSPSASRVVEPEPEPVAERPVRVSPIALLRLVACKTPAEVRDWSKRTTDSEVLLLVKELRELQGWVDNADLRLINQEVELGLLRNSAAAAEVRDVHDRRNTEEEMARMKAKLEESEAKRLNAEKGCEQLAATLVEKEKELNEVTLALQAAILGQKGAAESVRIWQK
jgi:hypothetical protein